MAVPKRRTSRSNTHSRRSQWKANAPQLAKCDRGHVILRAHGVPDLRPLRRPSGDRRLRVPLRAPRIAVDLLGGDAGLPVVVDGALLAAEQWPELSCCWSVPPDEATGRSGRARRSTRARRPGCASCPRRQRIAMDEDPVRAVRSRRDATVRVASRLVRDGDADATVSVGSTGAAVAAALFTLGRLPGVTRPPLAVTVPGAARARRAARRRARPSTAAPDLLVQFALAGAAYARIRLGDRRSRRSACCPTVREPGKGDPVRTRGGGAAGRAAAGAGVRFAGNVESAAVALGGQVDVVITDGFTGNVLLKGMEAAVAAVLAAGAPTSSIRPAPQRLLEAAPPARRREPRRRRAARRQRGGRRRPRLVVAVRRRGLHRRRRHRRSRRVWFLA